MRLHRACFRSALPDVQRAIDLVTKANGASAVNAMDNSGWAPIHIAAYQGRADVVTELLNVGANAGLLTRDGALPIALAAQQSKASTAAALLEAHPLSNAELGKLLWVTAFQADTSVLEVLLRAGAPVDALNGEGQTCLHVACHMGLLPAVQVLLAAGASTALPDASGGTPLHIACFRNHMDVVRALVEGGAALNTISGVTPVCVAAQNGHTEIVQVLGRAGARVSLREEHPTQGPFPLFMAAQVRSHTFVVATNATPFSRGCVTRVATQTPSLRCWRSVQTST